MYIGLSCVVITMLLTISNIFLFCVWKTVSDFLALQIITSKGPESLFLEIDVDKI